MTEAVTGLKQTNSLRGNIFWWKRVDGIWSILPKSAVERSRESWTHFWKRREYWGTATSYAVRAKVRKVVQFVHALFMVEIWSLHKFFTWPVIFSCLPFQNLQHLCSLNLGHFLIVLCLSYIAVPKSTHSTQDEAAQ